MIALAAVLIAIGFATYYAHAPGPALVPSDGTTKPASLINVNASEIGPGWTLLASGPQGATPAGLAEANYRLFTSTNISGTAVELSVGVFRFNNSVLALAFYEVAYRGLEETPHSPPTNPSVGNRSAYFVTPATGVSVLIFQSKNVVVSIQSSGDRKTFLKAEVLAVAGKINAKI